MSNEEYDITEYMRIASNQAIHICCYCGKDILPTENEKIAEPPWRVGFPPRKFGGNLCHKECESYNPPKNFRADPLPIKIVGEVIEHGIHYDIYEDGSKVLHGKPKGYSETKAEFFETSTDVPILEIPTKEEAFTDSPGNSTKLPSLFSIFVSFIEQEYSKDFETVPDFVDPFLDIQTLEQVEEILEKHHIDINTAYRKFIYEFDKRANMTDINFSR